MTDRTEANQASASSLRRRRVPSDSACQGHRSGRRRLRRSSHVLLKIPGAEWNRPGASGDVAGVILVALGWRGFRSSDRLSAVFVSR